MKTSQIKIIAFDADDTLWVNETFFREAELHFAQIMSDYGEAEDVIEKLFETEMNNIHLYGFGIKGFTLSLIETALKISNYQVSTEKIEEIIGIGKTMIHKPVDLLPGVKEVIKELKEKQMKMIVATKGDLLDQERKLKKSQLLPCFHHIEVMSDKKEEDYQKLLNHLDIKAENFLMVGNSLKSDILPVLNMGGHAVYIPFHTTWKHEQMTDDFQHANMNRLTSIKELPELLARL
jgi:putative hydrolase of the HAD superfamily